VVVVVGGGGTHVGYVALLTLNRVIICMHVSTCSHKRRYILRMMRSHLLQCLAYLGRF
jgi:hypothetical protein